MELSAKISFKSRSKYFSDGQFDYSYFSFLIVFDKHIFFGFKMLAFTNLTRFVD